MANFSFGTAAVRQAAASLIVVVALALALAPALVLAGSFKEDAARRNLRDAERLRNEQLMVGKEAAARAQRADAAALRLAQDRVTAAARQQQADAAIQDAAERIDGLAAKQRDAERRLKERAAAMQPLLPLIERLSLYPVETLLAMPEPPEATLRGVMVLKGLSRQMEIEAEALRQDQAELDAARAALAAEVPKLAQAQAAQAREAASLDRQIALAHAERARAEAEGNQAASEAATAAARMDTLRAAINELEVQQRAEANRAREEAARAREEAERAERHKRPLDAQAARRREAMLMHPTSTGSMAGGGSPAGQLQTPVVGVVVKGWGEATDGGPATGVSYHAPPAARVVSPCGGRVVFADTFRSYGLLLIIDCGRGYHVVLAGFNRLDVRLGQHVVAAEPVGVMPSWEPGSTTQRPALYVELRHDGQPVNPVPWLKPS